MVVAIAPVWITPIAGTINGLRAAFTALSPHLNERERRLFAATEAAAAGYGGDRCSVSGDGHRGEYRSDAA